jgi:phage baseplate assembly protein W
MPAERNFLGTGWAFPPAFDGRTLQAVMVSDEQDVRESLRILLSTVPGERVMHPTYGCGLRRMVFEQVTESLLTEIRSLVEKAVLFFEQRITLERIDFDTDALFDGVLKLCLFYTLRSTNAQGNMVFPLYLDGGAR